MKVSVEQEGKNIVHVELEVEAERASRAYDTTCRELSQHVEIPGFRKGKAPKNVVEKRFGKEVIKKEALDRLVPELLQQAVADKELDIITNPEIEECKFEIGEPLKLKAKFEIRPEVKLGDYSTIKVEVPQAKVPDDAMESALDKLATQKSTLQPVDKPQVEMNDHILLDFECMVDGKLTEGGKAEGLTLEVKEGNFIPGFCEKMVGHKAGDEFEVDVTFPDDYRNPKLASKDATFKVSLKEIRAKVIPSVDDELAKAVGHENLEQLKADITKQMEEEVETENQSRVQKAVVDAIVKSAQVEIPETMVEREYKLLMQQIRSFVEQNGQAWDEYEKTEELKALDKTKHTEASQRVLHSLVLGAVVRAEKIDVTQDEIASNFLEFAQRNYIPQDKFKEMAANEYFMRQLMEEVLTGKVVDFLVSKADVTYVEETPENTKGLENVEAAAEKPKEKEKASKKEAVAKS
ncbi:MAG: trigger factor [Candidatus Melainabacteria bacterium]|nr:MAG: trigger factor [Candidatus Melainabacteria bacterium]